jgi:HEAT repeat protein
MQVMSLVLVAVVALQQDPTDSLWRAARQALNRADYAAAASLYGDLATRYPGSARAGDALYWAAFALYKNDNLDRARGLLVTQQQRHPKAATLHDGDALLARIQAALAKQGDADAAAWLAARARQAGGSGGRGAAAPTASCPSENEDDDVRIAALNGLLQMDPENAVPILKKVLARRDACSAGLRRKAVFIVSQKQTGETEDVLLDAAQHDPDPEVRQQAVFWLSQVPSERAVGMLDSILRTTDDDELREKAIFALSQQHSPRAAAIIRGYAENPRAPAAAREKAIFWLGQQDSPENATFLRGLYAKLSDADLKEKVIFSLSQMGGAENGRWLMDIATNESEPIEMRKKALFWAGQTGADLSQLTALYDRMQNREMKEQLIFVYSQRHEAAALDALIKIAKTEQERELRKKALFWLGQSHDPRAAQVLLEIINQ